MKKYKLIFLTLFVILILVCLTLVCPKGVDTELESDNDGFVEYSGEESKVYLDSDGYIHISGTKRIDDVEITNIKLKTLKARKCEITANVKNTSNNYTDVINAELVITMKDGTVTRCGGLISALNGYEEKEFLTQILADLTDVANIEFEKINLGNRLKEEE